MKPKFYSRLIIHVLLLSGLLAILLAELAPLQSVGASEAPAPQSGPHRVFLPFTVRPDPASRPMIAAFSATPASIQPGQNTILNWSVGGATSLRIEPAVGDVTGKTSISVQPDTSTTYTLVATNAAGETRATTSVTVGGTPPPPPPAAAFFLPGEAPMRGLDVAYDAQGGLHITFIRHSQQPDGEQVVYAYCAPAQNCNNVANWTNTTIATGRMGGTQIEVTSDGRPRIVFEPNYSFTHSNYVYAECNASCTVAGNWSSYQFTTQAVELPSAFGNETRRRDWFRLDPQGRPRMLVPLKGIAYYGSCDTNCSQAENWIFTEIRVREGDFVERGLEWPVLRFGPDGRLHALASNQLRAVYLTCAATCEQAVNWEFVFLSGWYNNITPGELDVVSFEWDLDVRNDGRVLVGVGGSRLTDGNKLVLFFWSCTSACTNLANWSGVTFDNLATGSLDVEFDRQGVPSFLFGGKRASDGLSITTVVTCISGDNCYGPEARWNGRIVDTHTAMENELPVGPTMPIACSRPMLEWGNYAVRLIFDGSNQARLFTTGMANAICQSGLGEYIDRWGTTRRTRDVDIWILMIRSRIVMVP